MEKRIIVHKQVRINHQERFVLMDDETGEIVDDAQGYGYKTVQGAYKAYRYKSLTKNERKARENKIKLIKRWCKNNNSIMEFLGQIEFEILKGSWGPDEHFDEKLVTAILISNGYNIEELGFTVKDLLKYGEC